MCPNLLRRLGRTQVGPKIGCAPLGNPPLLLAWAWLWTLCLKETRMHLSRGFLGSPEHTLVGKPRFFATHRQRDHFCTNLGELTSLSGEKGLPPLGSLLARARFRPLSRQIGRLLYFNTPQKLWGLGLDRQRDFHNKALVIRVRKGLPLGSSQQGPAFGNRALKLWGSFTHPFQRGLPPVGRETKTVFLGDHRPPG